MSAIGDRTLGKKVTAKQAHRIRDAERVLLRHYAAHENAEPPKGEVAVATFPASRAMLLVIEAWVKAYAFVPGKGRILKESDVQYRVNMACMLFGARMHAQMAGQIFLMDARKALFSDFEPFM